VTPKRWAYIRRQCHTLIWLLVAIAGTVVIALYISDDEWPHWATIILTPMAWWLSIRRIAADLLVDVIKEVDRRGRQR